MGAVRSFTGRGARLRSILGRWRQQRLCWGAALLTSTVEVAAVPEGGAAFVSMGDSYSANGNIAAAMMAAQGWTKDCAHSSTSWPSALSKRLGLRTRHDYFDASCLGAALVTGPGYTLAHEARKADEAGAFGLRTRLITIQLGMNDVWGATKATTFDAWTSCLTDLRRGCGLESAALGRSPDYRGVTGEVYAERLRAVVEYLRYRAPAARIVLVGYPELHAAGGRAWCLDAFGLGRLTQPRAAGMTEFMDRLDAAQRDAARLLGVEFFDTRAVTTGHGLCSSEPWVNGLFHLGREPFGIPFHPTVHGDDVVAAALARRLEAR